MNFLCKCLGGSHLYGLNVADSDLDYRGIFLNENVSTIIGLDKNEHQDLRHEGKDEFYWEFRHYLNSLRKTNTQSLELLFNDSWIEKSSLWDKVQANKHRLIDSKKLYHSLKGYLHNELRLATGERTGDIGSKRRNQIEKFGFSPKNFMNLIRLCFCGTVFFNSGEYPTNIKKFSSALSDLLLDIRLNPEKFSKKDLVEFAKNYQDGLDVAFESCSNHLTFDSKFANDLIMEAYYPILSKSLGS